MGSQAYMIDIREADKDLDITSSDKIKKNSNNYNSLYFQCLHSLFYGTTLDDVSFNGSIFSRDNVKGDLDDSDIFIITTIFSNSFVVRLKGTV